MMKRALAAVTVALVVAACGDGTGPGNEATVSLSFTSAIPGGAFSLRPTFSAAAGDTITVGGDVLVIDRAQLVLREIELKRVNHDVCDSIVGEDDGCEEFQTAPLLVDLPLGGATTTLLTVAIDTGSYDEIEFDLHKPSDDNAADSAFVAANPDFADISIRVTGSFNGTPFTWTSDVNAQQEIHLLDPIVIDSVGASTNVTLSVDVAAWFRTAAGALIDPATANKGGANESVVNNNVQNSFKGFEDRDRDGDDSDEL